jgi:hypothetical protein
MRIVKIFVPEGDCSECDMLRYTSAASTYPHCTVFREQPSKVNGKFEPVPACKKFNPEPQ